MVSTPRTNPPDPCVLMVTPTDSEVCRCEYDIQASVIVHLVPTSHSNVSIDLHAGFVTSAPLSPLCYLSFF